MAPAEIFVDHQPMSPVLPGLPNKTLRLSVGKSHPSSRPNTATSESTVLGLFVRHFVPQSSELNIFSFEF